MDQDLKALISRIAEALDRLAPPAPPSADINEAEARPLVQKYFGAIARGPVNTPAQADVPTLAAPIEQVLHDRVAQTRISRTWAVPGSTARKPSCTRVLSLRRAAMKALSASRRRSASSAASPRARAARYSRLSRTRACNKAGLPLQARPAHLERLQGLRAEGRLVLAGPHPALDTEDPGPAGFTGSLVVAEFPSLEAARAWADADPYVSAGVYERVTVKPFRSVLP